MRVGVFGGTFDPVHQGHLVIAQQVACELSLERVIFVPGGIPPHKELSAVRASAADRMEMVVRAVEGNPLFEVSGVEVEAGRKIYSVETVRILKEREPENEWYFISGADEVASLLKWRDPDILLEEAYMVAATRPGYDFTMLEPLRGRLKNFHNIIPVECTRLDISATEIRERVAVGKSIRYLVPEAVRELIEERSIYATEGEPEEQGVSGGKG